MAKGRGMRGYTGNDVPTSRVIKSASWVTAPRTKSRMGKDTPVRNGNVNITYTREAIERSIALFGKNLTVQLETEGM